MKNALALVGTALFSMFPFAANAQEAAPYEARFAARFGFALGNNFDVGNTTRHLEGFQIGGDIPLINRIPKVGALTFSPTIVFGGSNRMATIRTV